MTQIEIGNVAVCMALVIATLMIIIGWNRMPDACKQVAVGAVLMFIGYQIFEFVITSFIVIAK
jgi:hypothetical protein